MKRFLLTTIIAVAVPLCIALAIFLWTDPFRTLHQFDICDVDATNREYGSVELFRRNYDTYHYDAFVFGSSQASGLNTYTWATYLPDTVSTFLFQAYSETITGVKQKVEWLDQQGVDIKYALVLIDVPGFFSKNQTTTNAVSMKHWRLTGDKEWVYHAREYANFLQRPSFWLKNIRRKMVEEKEPFEYDTITNDFFATNKYTYNLILPQDSLKNCSEVTRQTFLARAASVSEDDVKPAPQVIDEKMVNILQDIKAVFDKQHTDYRIIITPIYRYTNPYMCEEDFATLTTIFPQERIYDFSTNKEFTSDYNDFSDPVHFGLRMGGRILKTIYLQQYR